ncbi:MAG: ATP-binding cassette domain-containing protein [Flavobacteriaceae bacterium]|nr:ATP-binding cassette domain-containing protein [Flavobacteriaceae bacterium]
MEKKKHWAILISSETRPEVLTDNLFSASKPAVFKSLHSLNGALFSNAVLSRFIYEEEKHERHLHSKNTRQPIALMSGGEQKKLLLNHLLQQDRGFLVLDSPFDNLDAASQLDLEDKLDALSTKIPIILIVRRKKDILPFVSEMLSYEEGTFKPLKNMGPDKSLDPEIYKGTVPLPLEEQTYSKEVLIAFNNIAVSYGNSPVLKDINWIIKPGTFWQLTGPNGSGKTTLLSMINGDNVKGYGQDLQIFGNKKGSGESVWDLKSRIGFFTNNMIQQFTGRYTVIEMLTGGFFDSVGLYQIPSELQIEKSEEWLAFLGLEHLRDTAFSELSLGQKYLVMIARAMIKHPLLLILDEPTNALDDTSVKLLVTVINKIASESKSAILYVSHREEKGLNPDHIFQLVPGPEGSIGNVIK